MPPKKPQENPADLEKKAAEDAEAARQSTLVASTFANVQLESTKQTLAQYVTLYNAAREEIARLTNEMQERDRDAMLVVQFLRNDLDKRQEQLKEQREEHTREIEKVRKGYDGEISDLQGTISSLRSELAEKGREIDKLNSELDALAAFRRERRDMHVELTRFKDEHLKSIDKYESELSKQRFLSLEEKVRLKAAERDMERRFATEVQERAMQLLDARTKQIHHENFQLLQDKALVDQELQRMTNAHEKMSAALADTQRELDLATTSDVERTKRAVGQTREAKDLRHRIATLENQLAQVVTQYEKKLVESQALLDRTTANATAERNAALSAASTSHRELVKVRALATQIVTQRGELETFFHEALDYVRNEIAKERKQQATSAKSIVASSGRILPSPAAVSAGSQHAPLPAVPGRAPPSQRETPSAFFGADAQYESIKVFSDTNPSRMSTAAAGALEGTTDLGRKAESGALVATSNAVTAATGKAASSNDPLLDKRLDIAQLSWADKERVLRILFAKINSVNNRPPAKSAALSSTDRSAMLPALPAIAGRAAAKGDDGGAFFVTSGGSVGGLPPL